MGEFDAYYQIADKLGVFVLGVLLFVALNKKWLIFGWHHAEVKAERDKCWGDLSARTTKAESDLERLREGR